MLIAFVGTLSILAISYTGSTLYSDRVINKQYTTASSFLLGLLVFYRTIVVLLMERVNKHETFPMRANA